MEKKYILTEETKVVNGHTLHRIKSLRDFNNVHEGDLGGFVETEHNLSHDDNAWVYGNAKVYGDAMVYDSAMVYNDAKVYGNARVYGNAWVYDDATVYNMAMVYGNAIVCGNAKVYDNAQVYGNVWVFGYAKVYDNAKVYGSAFICDNAKVYGDATVYEYARVYGNAIVCGNAEISSIADYIVFKNWWSSGRYFTWTRSNDKWSVGCFYGSGKELINKAYKDSETSGREYQRIVEYVENIKNKTNEGINDRLESIADYLKYKGYTDDAEFIKSFIKE